MVTVGVKVLKNQLSRYLELVKNGERVLITQHNQPIAEITVPQKDITDNESPERSMLRRLAGEGRAVLAKRFESTAQIPEAESIDYMSILNAVRADRS
jgi:antitoxin (DNA-binding transcriptional repressor) of toxin-antitoxin stability system